MLSIDLRFFALANFQQLKLENAVWTMDEYPDNDVLVELVEGPPDMQRTRAYDQANNFVWGGELRVEAAYSLTRDISLRFGFAFMELGQGIGRGNDIRLNDQDVVLAGATFGVTINR